jgi:hypothetical protein
MRLVKRLASSSNDFTVKEWDAATGKELHELLVARPPSETY